MANSEFQVITGAYSYTGKYITRRLLAQGNTVKTLTGHPDRPNPFGAPVVAMPYYFDDPQKLAASLHGATVLYNTYWVRFAHDDVTFQRAVDNTKTLVCAAQEAGVTRIVHVSITNADAKSPLPYFRGKGQLEDFIRQTRLSYALVRPTVIFGDEDILINNIAWLLRRFPVFGVLGNGDYRLQPVYVEDMADLVVNLGAQEENVVVDAVGPDIFTFDELVRLIAREIQSRAFITHMPPALAYAASKLIGYLVGDVILTRDEVAGLMANLLISDKPPTGKTRLADWLRANAQTAGARYASELARHH